MAFLRKLEEFYAKYRIPFKICAAISLAAWVVLVAFFWRYWWNALKTVPEIWETMSGTTRIAAITGTCVASLAWSLERLFTNGLTMTGAITAVKAWIKSVCWVVVAWLIIMLFYVFVCAPSGIHDQQLASISTLTNSVARRDITNRDLALQLENSFKTNTSLSSDNSTLKADLERSKRATNELQSLELAKSASKAAAQAMDAANEGKSLIAIQAKTNDLAKLQAIVDAPIPTQRLEISSDKIDPDAIDSVLKSLRTKDLARDAMAKLDAPNSQPQSPPLKPEDVTTLKNCAPVADYCVELFREHLNELAKQFGDELSAKDFIAVSVYKRGVESDYEEFRFKKNTDWAFRIFFRRESDVGNYSLFIYRNGAQLFECRFTQHGFAFKVALAPRDAEKYGAVGNGKLETPDLRSLRRSLEWVISIQKERFPLKN